MNREKRVSLVLIVGLLVAGIWIGGLTDSQPTPPTLSPYNGQQTTDLTEQTIKEDPALGPVIVSESEAGHTNYSHKKIYVDNSFTSHLPIVVVDTGDQKPSRGVVWDRSKQYYIPTGEDPYAYGSISIIDGACNQVTDPASMTTDIKIKIRGNSSGTYDKKQYLIKTLNKSGKTVQKNVMDLGNGSEWVLNVSFADKSLIRNFLALSTAKVLRAETPDAKYCEVLWKEGDRYRYDGVYLMIERVSVGENRVNLPQYAENTAHIPALYRRDRYTPSDLMLENYAYVHNLSSGRIGVLYPEREVLSGNAAAQLTQQIDRLERALYSDDPEEFYQYRKYVDLDSFVDYFILNEFFLNYDAGYNSTYFFSDYSGKIHMGPVWDFDQGMHNSSEYATDLYTTAFHSAPWFDRMLRDPMFTEKIQQRYHELRQSILSDAAMDDFISAITLHLGPAPARDWARWGYYYKNDSYLTTTGGAITTTWEDEVARIRYTLKEHAQWLDQHIDSLYQFKMMSLDQAKEFTSPAGDTPRYGSLLAVVFVIGFFVSVNLVLRKESE